MNFNMRVVFFEVFNDVFGLFGVIVVVIVIVMIGF